MKLGVFAFFLLTVLALLSVSVVGKEDNSGEEAVATTPSSAPTSHIIVPPAAAPFAFFQRKLIFVYVSVAVVAVGLIAVVLYLGITGHLRITY